MGVTEFGVPRMMLKWSNAKARLADEGYVTLSVDIRVDTGFESIQRNYRRDQYG